MALHCVSGFLVFKSKFLINLKLLNYCINIAFATILAAKNLPKCAVGDNNCAAQRFTYIIQHSDGKLKSTPAKFILSTTFNYFTFAY